MSSITSVARKVLYTHVPKDGKTPVYDSTSKNWSYVENPSLAQILASASRLHTVDSNASTALGNAAAAQETADSKTTVPEVCAEVFPSTDISGNPVVMTHLQFSCTDDGWVFQFCFHPIGKPNQATCAVLAYPTRSELEALAIRIEAIEKRLGIS